MIHGRARFVLALDPRMSFENSDMGNVDTAGFTKAEKLEIEMPSSSVWREGLIRAK